MGNSPSKKNAVISEDGICELTTICNGLEKSENSSIKHSLKIKMSWSQLIISSGDPFVVLIVANWFQNSAALREKQKQSPKYKLTTVLEGNTKYYTLCIKDYCFEPWERTFHKSCMVIDHVINNTSYTLVANQSANEDGTSSLVYFVSN
eukprot:389133_1